MNRTKYKAVPLMAPILLLTVLLTGCSSEIPQDVLGALDNLGTVESSTSFCGEESGLAEEKPCWRTFVLSEPVLLDEVLSHLRELGFEDRPEFDDPSEGVDCEPEEREEILDEEGNVVPQPAQFLPLECSEPVIYFPRHPGPRLCRTVDEPLSWNQCVSIWAYSPQIEDNGIREPMILLVDSTLIGRQPE